ncbi:MAG: DUF5662 family protein [Clostridia bacterium]
MNWIKIRANKEKEEYFEKRTKEHIDRVINAANKIIEKFPEFEKIKEKINEHDSSKLKEPERTPYIDITWRHKFDNYNSYKQPGKLEKQQENDATLHHIINNEHHPEYWLEDKSKANIDEKDRDKSKECIDATKMPEEALLEMVADWQAMSEELKKNTARQWYDSQKDVRWHFSEEQDKTIDKFLKVFEAK